MAWRNLRCQPANALFTCKHLQASTDIAAGGIYEKRKTEELWCPSYGQPAFWLTVETAMHMKPELVKSGQLYTLPSNVEACILL